MKRLWLLTLAAVVAVALIGCGTVKSALNVEPKNTLYAVYQADDPGDPELATKMKEARTIMLSRLKALGLPSATAALTDDGGLRVEIPSVPDPQGTFEALGATAKLEFIDPGGAAVLTGRHIVSAKAEELSGEHAVHITFDSEGTRLFADATTRLVGQSLSIVLDGAVINAPTIQSAITGGQAYIEANFTQDEAERLAAQLQGSEMPLKLELAESGSTSNTEK
jgi:preprotein translocase subunit SecD